MKVVTRMLRGLVATVVIVASISVWTAAAAAPARSVVDNLDNQLIATMKHGKQLGFAGRYKKLAPVIDQSFDLHRIAKLALGSNWSKLSPGQQKAYLRMFRKDTIATYASRFDSYGGQTFKIKSAKDAPGGRRQVNTVIVSGNKEIPIDYVLDNTGGQWKIVNVVAKGVSDLALKRGQYTGAIKESGPAGFIKKFKHQLTKYPSIPNVPEQGGGAGSAPAKSAKPAQKPGSGQSAQGAGAAAGSAATSHGSASGAAKSAPKKSAGAQS